MVPTTFPNGNNGDVSGDLLSPGLSFTAKVGFIDKPLPPPFLGMVYLFRIQLRLT